MATQPAFRLTDQMLNDILNIEYVRDHLEIRLIPEKQISNHTEQKRCMIRLQHCDFGLGFAVRINENFAVTITEDYLLSTGLSLEDYWQIWLQSEQQNIEITPMDTLIASFFTDPSIERPETTLPIYVCKYKHNGLGGGCVLHPEVQKKLLDLIGPFYIIFSSVYEALIIAQKDANAKDLQDMLRETNAKPDIVSPEDVATQYIYGVVKESQLERIVIE